MLFDRNQTSHIVPANGTSDTYSTKLFLSYLYYQHDFCRIRNVVERKNSLSNIEYCLTSSCA